MELRDRLDDPRAADAGHPSVLERRLVRPRVAPDHADARLERPGVDADALDRAGRRTLAARDLCALERWAGWARRSEQPVTVTEHDLGVRPDVDDQVHLVAEVRALGEDHAGRVGAHVARDAGQYVDTCTPVNGQAELARWKSNRLVDRESERRAAERRGIDPEQEVVHDRIADDRHLEDVRAARSRRCVASSAVSFARQPRTTFVSSFSEPGLSIDVGDAAHEVLAEADLRVHLAGRGQHLSGEEVAEVARNGRRADVEGDPVARDRGGRAMRP